MEHVTYEIFRWEGKIERTEEEEKIARKNADAVMKQMLEQDSFIKAQREAWKREQEKVLKVKSENTPAEA